MYMAWKRREEKWLNSESGQSHRLRVWPLSVSMKSSVIMNSHLRVRTKSLQCLRGPMRSHPSFLTLLPTILHLVHLFVPQTCHGCLLHSLCTFCSFYQEHILPRSSWLPPSSPWGPWINVNLCKEPWTLLLPISIYAPTLLCFSCYYMWNSFVCCLSSSIEVYVNMNYIYLIYTQHSAQGLALSRYSIIYVP